MNEFLKTLLPALVILALAFIGLGITILLKRGGKFPNTHIHGNRQLNKQGVNCAQSDDRIEQLKAKKTANFRNVTLLKKQDGQSCQPL